MKIKNEILLKKLQKSGLNEKESLIYLALLELGGAFPSKIAEYTGIKRGTVYSLLLQMSVKGVVNEVEKKNKLFYQLENPSKLLKYTKSKLSLIQDEINQAQTILPIIQDLMHKTERPKVTYYQGIDGVINVYEDHIQVEVAYEMLAWANATKLEQALPDNFFKKYRREKERMGIATRAIVPETESDKGFTARNYDGFKESIIPLMKFVPAGIFAYNAEITIYGENKVSIVNLEDDNFTGVIIEDKTIHGLMKMIFELSWNAKLDK